MIHIFYGDELTKLTLAPFDPIDFGKPVLLHLLTAAYGPEANFS
jgi:hypothetical protein